MWLRVAVGESDEDDDGGGWREMNRGVRAKDRAELLGDGVVPREGERDALEDEGESVRDGSM